MSLQHLQHKAHSRRHQEARFQRRLCPVSYSCTYRDISPWKRFLVLTVASYDDLSTRNFLSADSEFLYCQSPGCSSGQMHDASTEGYIFRCTECGYRYCTSCKVAFHTDETCTQYQERIAKEREEELRIQKEQEEASLAEVTKVSVACPGCGANIQKSYGCDHMTCKRPIHPCRTFTNKISR
jgi:hypothetical protein